MALIKSRCSLDSKNLNSRNRLRSVQGLRLGDTVVVPGVSGFWKLIRVHRDGSIEALRVGRLDWPAQFPKDADVKLVRRGRGSAQTKANARAFT